MTKNIIPSRHNRNIGIKYSDILKDIELLTNSYLMDMFKRTARMFEWKNLPSYIPIRDIELILQNGGYIYFKKVDDKIYGLYGFLGGEYNAYYNATKITIANPYLKEFDIANLENENEGVLIFNDSARVGIGLLNYKYARMISHADISLKRGLVNSRIPSILITDNDNDVESVKKFFEDVENGTIKGLFNKRFLLNEDSGLKNETFINSSVNSLTSLIEVRQYYYAQWLNELGLQANYNMKREAINGEEAGLNEESIKPLVDDMLLCRREGVKKLNELFNLNVEVDYSSSWKERKVIGSETKENNEGGGLDDNEKDISK